VDVAPIGGGIVRVGEVAPISYPVTLTFGSGTSVNLEVVPAPGYNFKGWGGDLSSTANATAIVMDCNKKVTAMFSQIMYTLTMRVSGSGSISPAVGHYSYGVGTGVTIRAIPDSGWQFDGWTGDVADPGSATTTVIADSDKTSTANFSQVTPTWGLIGGIVGGAIVIVGMTIWFAARRRTT